MNYKSLKDFQRESLKGNKIESSFKPAFEDISAKDIRVKSMYQTNVFDE